MIGPLNDPRSFSGHVRIFCRRPDNDARSASTERPVRRSSSRGGRSSRARPRRSERRVGCSQSQRGCAARQARRPDIGRIALRYGAFYDAANDGLIELVRKRRYPIVGLGGGRVSFIHLEDAAAATVLALEHEAPSTTSSTPSPRGCRCSPRPWARSRRGASPPGSRGSWRVNQQSSWVPRPVAPRTRRRSASSGGGCATRAGGKGSPRRTRRPPREPVVQMADQRTA